jgi:hypothetical protein
MNTGNDDQDPEEQKKIEMELIEKRLKLAEENDRNLIGTEFYPSDDDLGNSLDDGAASDQ